MIEPAFRPRIVYSRDDARGSARQPREPVKVLVAEDDYLVGMQMEQALTDAGFAVAATVATAEEAIEKAAAEDVALVIMDIRLAGRRDGVDAALELFERHGIRVFFFNDTATTE